MSGGRRTCGTGAVKVDVYYHAMDANIELPRTCGGEWSQWRLRSGWYKAAAEYWIRSSWFEDGV